MLGFTVQFLRHSLVLIVFFFGTWALLLSSPLGKSSIHMTVETSAAGFSQMFFAEEENSFSEEYSRWQPLTVGENDVSFPFGVWRGTLGDFQRWDPIDQPSNIRVSGLSLSSWFYQEELPLDLLRPSIDTSQLVPADSAVEFSAESNDSQLLMNAQVSNFYFSNLIRVGLLALTLVAGMFLAFLLFRRVRRKTITEPVRRIDATVIGAELAAVPKWVAAASIGYLMATVTILLLGSVTIGVSWDEPAYVASLQEFVRSGWFTPRAFFVDGVVSAADSLVHGPVGPVVTQFQSVLFGSETGSFAAATAESYEVRHLATALLALVGIFAVGMIAKITFHSLRWGLIAAMALSSIPLFIGYGMFNIQDIPVAVGFIFVTLAMVIVGSAPRDSHLGVSKTSWTLVTLFVGSVLSIGTRPGMWLPVVTFILGSLVIWFVFDSRVQGLVSARRKLFRRFMTVVVGLFFTYVALWIVYPVAFGDPWTLLTDSLSASTAFPWQGKTLVAGMLLPAQPPWYYIPLWLSAQLPLVISVFAAIGIVGSAIHVVRKYLSKACCDDWTYLLVPVVIPVVGIPVVTVILNTTMYSGVRQLLFLVPGIALLAVAGIRLVIKSASGRFSSRNVQLMWAALSVGLIIPLIGQVSLFPYSYAFLNAATATKPINGNWEVDGWWLSGKELVEKGPLAQRTVCVESASRPIADCATAGVITPFLPVEIPADREIILAEDEYLALNRFDENLTGDQCNQLFTVDRQLYWQKVKFSETQVCQAQLKAYPNGGVSFESEQPRADLGALWGENSFLLWGWGEPSPNGVPMINAQASSGFTLSNDVSLQDASISISGYQTAMPEGSPAVAVYANGVEIGQLPAVLANGSIEFTLKIPAEAADKLDSGRLVIRFEVPYVGEQPQRIGEWLKVSTGFQLKGISLGR